MHRRVVILALALLAAAQALSAHHSIPVNYDQSREITVEGVITEIKWLNPHAHFRIDVTSAGGSTAEWLVEMGAANTMKRAGFPMEKFAVGDPITIIGNPGRRDRTILLNETVLKDGTRMNPTMRPRRAGPAGDAG